MRRKCRLLIGLVLGLLTIASWAQDASPSDSDKSQNQKPSGSAKDTGNQDGQKGTDNKPKEAGDTPADTSKMAFDERTNVQATALAYRSMQELSAYIAAQAPKLIIVENGASKEVNSDEYVIYDSAAFASINEYRIMQPQIGLLKTGLCAATRGARMRSGSEYVVPGIEGLISGGVDTLEKPLKLMQTETTIKGATVNVTDAALIAEVAERLRGRLMIPTISQKFSIPASILSQLSNRTRSKISSTILQRPVTRKDH